jgi:hypothetical protein
MRVILSNGRQFIVKVRYSTEYKQTHVKDEFQRDVYTEWEEHNTALTITEWFKDANMAKVTVTGFAHCNYQDQFNKEVGKSLAYFRALEQLEALKIINEYEAEELASFKLNHPVYQCKKVEKSVKVGK